MRAKTVSLVLLVLVLGSGLVWATTYHSITVDGNLTDFAANEKLAVDPAKDSIFGVNNDLQNAYLTWDLNNLYLGFDFTAWGTAVMYLLDLSSSTGATSFCPTAGYNGAFPANFVCGNSTNADFMVALFVPAGSTTSISAYVYKITPKNSTDITKNLLKAPVVKFTSDIPNQKHTGTVELAISWNTLFQAGAGKVSKCAKLGLAGVIRGQYDSSALGDANPNNTLGDKSHTCYTASSKISTISTWHTVDLDKNCDEIPEQQWMPASNKMNPVFPDAGPDQAVAKPDMKVPQPDSKVTPDKASKPDTAPVSKDGQVVKPDNKVATPDSKVAQPDAKVATPDAKAGADKGAGMDKGAAKPDKGASKDMTRDVWGSDSGYTKPPESGDGCACTASGEQAFSGAAGMGLLLAVMLIPGHRRRRKRNL